MTGMKAIITAILLLAGMQTMAQTKNYDTLRDEENKQLVYKGSFTMNDLTAEPSFEWMRTGAAEYTPDAKDMQALTAHLGQYKLIIFMGTWCDDSHNLVPKLCKILNVANYSPANVTLYGVDRAKTTGSKIEKTYNVTLVPTIIIMDGDKEKGRITETVDKSIEADMRKIMGL